MCDSCRLLLPGECSANPTYMHANCAKSCGTCQINKRREAKATEKAKVAVSDDALEWVKRATAFGEEQKVAGSEAPQTVAVIRGAVQYMENEVSDLPNHVLQKCLNRNALCAFWAALGEW